jgi:hypothetical protein
VDSVPGQRREKKGSSAFHRRLDDSSDPDKKPCSTDGLYRIGGVQVRSDTSGRGYCSLESAPRST